MNSPLQHSGDENGSSASTVSNDQDQTSGGLMSVSESGSELQHSGDENDQESCISALESESESKSKSESSRPSSNRATESGGTSSDFTMENFLFRAQLRPGDVEDDRLTLLRTISDNFFGEAGTSRRQQLLLFCDCHENNWQMKFKDPPLDCGRLGIIGLKAFVAAHNLGPPDVICFHQRAQPVHLNHYFVHGVRIRPRTVPQPAIAIGNDNDDDDDDDGNGGGSDREGDGEPNPSSGNRRRRGDGGPNSSNSDKGKGVDCVTPHCSRPSSNRATESGGTSFDFTMENFLFRAQLRPGDVEDDRLTLLQTVSDNFFGEAGTSRRQQLLLFCDCHENNWQMKFKDPPLDCGRLGIIGLKAFVAAHNLRPPDVICFHQRAQPVHLNHFFVHGVRIRPRTVPQPAIAIRNDNDDEDEDEDEDDDDDYDDGNGGGSDGEGAGEPNPSSGDRRRGGDGGPNSSNSDKGKGVDCVTTRPGGGGSNRGESSGGKGKVVITAGNENLETCLFEKELAEKDVVGPSMEKPISLLQADLWKDLGVLIFSDDWNENWFVAFEFVM